MKKKTFILVVLSVLLIVGVVHARDLTDNSAAYIKSPWTFGKDVTMNKNLVIDGSIKGAINPGTGKIWYVDSNTGDDSGAHGTSVDKPFDSVDYAIGKCTANNGDIVMVMPGHAENLVSAAVIDADVAGISIIGLGNGSDRPTFTYTAAAGSFAIGADNVTIENLFFKTASDYIHDVVVGVAIEDGVDYATVRNCEFLAGETEEFLVSIRTGDASNYALIEGCLIDNGLNGAVAGISFTKDTKGTIVRNNVIKGDYSTANINGITTASTELHIHHNLLINGSTLDFGTEPVIELVTQSTGIINDNYCVCNLATMIVSIIGDEMILFQNWYNEDVNPGTGTVMGTASADG